MAKPIIALIYDFDKTLCTKNMQEYEFIPDKMGMAPGDFWAAAGKLAADNKMDGILAYMYLMVEMARDKKVRVSRQDFVRLGENMEFYPGVGQWFGKINNFGSWAGVVVEHYIISSGLKEIIEGCSIFGHFSEVFASEFLYDEYDRPSWPKNAVNYTTKTQFLFRISKNVLDLSHDDGVNEHVPENARRISFANMIYIGDGLTDVPCMRLVKKEGGHSIAVYEERRQVEHLLRDERVNYILPADYGEDWPLYKRVCDIIGTRAEIERLKGERI
ncbi:MAG: haloacid dehalogenase-like hydrolase [Defluviitaleaceae bacterium]|nr:haloacid dehalogenase-like hydrolase [Defluviitaleaceae bacterium]